MVLQAVTKSSCKTTKQCARIYILITFINNIVLIISVEMLISVVGDQHGIFL